MSNGSGKLEMTAVLQYVITAVLLPTAGVVISLLARVSVIEDKVNTLVSRPSATKDDVALAIATTAPWLRDRDDVLKRLQQLEADHRLLLQMFQEVLKREGNK